MSYVLFIVAVITLQDPLYHIWVSKQSSSPIQIVSKPYLYRNWPIGFLDIKSFAVDIGDKSRMVATRQDRRTGLRMFCGCQQSLTRWHKLEWERNFSRKKGQGSQKNSPVSGMLVAPPHGAADCCLIV
jgi:hypothetical protein